MNPVARVHQDWLGQAYGLAKALQFRKPGLLVKIPLDLAFGVRYALCRAAVNVQPKSPDMRHILMRALIEGAKLGAAKIHVDLGRNKFLDGLVNFLPCLQKPLIWIPTYTDDAVAPFLRKDGVE
jgi:hypothetical protein